MASLDKLLARLRNTPKAARYSDLVRLLGSVGWRKTGGRGSHERFEPADRSGFIVIVKPHGREPFCAVVDVIGVIELVESYRGPDSDD